MTTPDLRILFDKFRNAGNNILLIGHRGCRVIEPENTISAFETAVSKGADMIEIDIHLSADEKIVVIHDETIEGQTINSLSFAQLGKFDLGKGQRIPLLKETIDFISKNSIQLNIEVKETGRIVPLLGELISKSHGINQLIVSSFHVNVLEEIKRIIPAIRTGMLFNNIPEDPQAIIQEAIRLQCFSIHPFVLTISDELIEEAHEKDLQVYIWTVNDPEDMGILAEMGVDGIMTDFYHED